MIIVCSEYNYRKKNGKITDVKNKKHAPKTSKE